VIPKKLAILPTVLVAGLVAFVLLATVPPPGVNITLVAANPGLKTAETRIDTLKLEGTGGYFAIYTDTGQTQTVEVGTNLNHGHVTVFIAKIYASTGSEAIANTKVTVTIKNPAGGTVYTGSLTPWIVATERATWWEVDYDAGIDSHNLVEGQYTVTAKYEIYV